MRKIICLLLSFLFLASCSAEKNEGIQPNNDEVSVSTNDNIESELTPQENVFNEYSVLIAVKTINIRRDPSTASNENIVGKAHMGETYTVFEQCEDDDYVWYRIGDNEWIANDGTWCVEYGKKEKNGYPYVMNESERLEFLDEIETGAHCMSSDYNGKFTVLNIFKNPGEIADIFNCNILLGLDGSSGTFDSYKYIVNNIVETDKNVFDVYVTPVMNDGVEDYSTGFFRFTDIGTYIGDGNPDDLRMCFDITLIQNHNDIKDGRLGELYENKMHFIVSQVSY